MSKFLGLDNVLCLSPHPDDVELSMSGTIRKHQDTHFAILCCSNGLFSLVDSQQRVDEVRSFWKLFYDSANVSLFFLNEPMSVRREYSWVSLIGDHIHSDIQAVFVTPAIDSHFEHQLMNRVATASVRHQRIGLIEYKTFSTLSDWDRNIFVELDHNTFEMKLIALKEFKSQQDRTYFQRNYLEAAHGKPLPAREQFRVRSLHV